MFQILSLTIVAAVFALAARFGPQRALLYAWPPAMTFLPVWMILEVGSVTLDLRTVAELSILAAFAAFPARAEPIRLGLCDYLVALLIAVLVVSQFNAGSLRPLTVPEIARKWFLPYWMGRLFIRNEDDLRDAAALFAKLLVALTALTVFECFVKINPINKALGMTFQLLEEGEGYRWGMKRAHVTFNHPIFYGMALVLLIPWAVEGARQAKVGGGPRWWQRLPLLVSVCLFCCVSRGPQLAGMFAALVYFFFRIPKIRWPLIIGCALVGLAAKTNADLIVEILGKAAGEKDEEKKFIEIEGEEYEYSGTNHRMLLFKVYDRAAANAGFFGYGSEMKGVVIDESLEQTFGSIDCHYLMFLLQHGSTGVGAFGLLTLAVLIKLGRAALQIEKPGSALAAGLAGSMAGVAILLISVWFSADFAGVWLFSAGVANRLQFPGRHPGGAVQCGLDEPENPSETRAAVRKHLTPDRPTPEENHHEQLPHAEDPDHQPR